MLLASLMGFSATSWQSKLSLTFSAEMLMWSCREGEDGERAQLTKPHCLLSRTQLSALLQHNYLAKRTQNTGAFEKLSLAFIFLWNGYHCHSKEKGNSLRKCKHNARNYFPEPCVVWSLWRCRFCIPIIARLNELFSLCRTMLMTDLKRGNWFGMRRVFEASTDG